MATKKEQASWLGRMIYNAAHAADLERSAAVFEFGQGLDRQASEDAAYQKYITTHHAKAAAHHLTQMKAARASGAFDAAAQHSSLYSEHIKKLGASPFDGPPPEVLAFVGSGPEPRAFDFKPHEADVTLLAIPKETSQAGMQAAPESEASPPHPRQ